MKICITFTDQEMSNAEELMAASKAILRAPLKMKRTPPRDGFWHIYIATRNTAKD